MEKSCYKIGEVSKLSGVGIETIRFYERSGLIQEPPRRPSGYREYPKDVVVRLQFIRRAKELGFSLNEIISLLSLRQDSAMRCGEVKKKAQAKITDIENRIDDLQRVKAALTDLIRTCKKPTEVDCPIVVSFESATNRMQGVIKDVSSRHRAHLRS